MPRPAILIVASILASAALVAQVPSDAEIHQILADRVGADNLGIGIVVGVIDSHGRRVIAYGSLAKDDQRRLDGDTVFEIGSMTKVFTSLVLMNMVRRSEVALTDPVAKFLPSTVKIPERNGRKITLADISTQSSGLPRMPTNFTPKDPANPYADYSVRQMYDFLSGYQLTRDIGSKYEYSNLAVGLLGHALSLRAGMSYEALVRSRICDPLKMNDTRVTLTPAMQSRLAVGHNAAREPVANWDLPTLAGAGALRSTAGDMLTFLAANLGYIKTPLAQDMADEVSIRRPTGMPDMEIAYAWHIETKDGSSIIWHNGGTGGYRTYMGYDPKARVGVVVLSNISTAAGPDDIGRHLLNAAYPLHKAVPAADRKEITLDPKILDKYIGAYHLAPSVVITVTRDADKLYAQLTGQPRFPVFAENETNFFYKVVDAQLTFAPEQVTLHQNGHDMVAKRVNPAELPKQKPSPGTEAAIRRTIGELQRGEANYDLMSPALANATRQQLPNIKSLLAKYGALQSVTFVSADAAAGDTYQVRFENATTDWTVLLSADGKAESLFFRPE